MKQKITNTILFVLTITLISHSWSLSYAQVKQPNEYIQITDETCFYKFIFNSNDILQAKVKIFLPSGPYLFEGEMKKNEYYQSGTNDLNRIKYEPKDETQKISIILGYEKNLPAEEIEKKLVEISIYVEVEEEKYYYIFKDENGLPMSFKME